MVQEKVIDKLRKLNAHAESAAKLGNEAEAQAFASMVQRLLLEHKLSMTDVEWEQREAEEPVERRYVDFEKHGLRNKKARVPWTEKLANIVARAHDCRMLLAGRHTNRVVFVGARSDVQQCEYTFIVLVRLAERVAERAYVKYFYECQAASDVTLARGFKINFLWGFLVRLQERLEAERSATRAGATTLALVHVSKALARVDRETDRIAGCMMPRIHIRLSENMAGTLEGRAAADRVELHRGVESRRAAPQLA